MNFVVVNDTHFMAKSGARLEIFPALIEKWEWVLGFCKTNNAVLLHTGDFFNASVVPDEVKSVIIQSINASGVKIFGIIGNHDQMYNNEQYFGKTSLHVLEQAGVVTIVRSEIDFGGVSVAPLGVKTSQPAIILGHAFLDQVTAPSVKLSDLDIYDKPTCIFLGHEHQSYPPAVVNVNVPSIVYRHGAFIRQTGDKVNDFPTVACVSFTNGVFDVQVMTIPHKPAVFISNSSHSIELNEVEVGALVASLNTITTETKDLNFYLQKVATPEVLSYLSTLK